MSDDDESRARRAAIRRATWQGERFRLGDPESALHEDATPGERMARLWDLTVRMWTFAGREIRVLPRAEWPIETFEKHPPG